MIGAWVDAVEHKRVKVRCEIESRAETLDGRDGSRASTALDAKVIARPTPLVGKQRSHEAPQNLARKMRVPGHSIAERKRKRENPLAHGDFGKNAVDQVGGRIRHAPPCARWTKPTSLARKRKQAVVAATIAMQPQETMCEHTALEVRAELALDERGDRSAPLPRIREEGFQLFADNFVEECLLGLMALVFDRGLLVGTAREFVDSKFGATDWFAFQLAALLSPRGSRSSRHQAQIRTGGPRRVWVPFHGTRPPTELLAHRSQFYPQVGTALKPERLEVEQASSSRCKRSPPRCA